MRLSGWQRLGVIASVLWFIGAYLHIAGQRYDLAARYAKSMQELCFEQHREKGDMVAACGPVWGKSYDHMSENAVQLSLMEAAIPIPIAWLFAWIARGLYRWVRRGFHKQRTP